MGLRPDPWGLGPVFLIVADQTRVTWDVHGPTPDPLWQARLDTIAPPGLSVQHLHLYWEPGYAWSPVERWMVGRVWPRHKLPVYMERRWLDGPNPATLGYWDKKEKKWVSLAPPISRRQWKFWQEHQKLLEPYWVVQGNGAGHKYRYTRQEQVVSRIHGNSGEPPAPGELCYAEPDSRMFVLLAQNDMVRQHLMGLNWVERKGSRVTEAEAKLTEHMRSQVWGWLSAQASEMAEIAASHSLRALWENAPVHDDGPSYNELSARQQDSFVNTSL